MKRKMLLVSMIAACLFAGYESRGTVLYMKAGAEMVNHLEFTGENGMDAVLEEPSWSPSKGLLTIPGSVIPKDPIVTNTSEAEMDELVALRCEFVYTESCPDKELSGKRLSTQDMEKVAEVYEIDYNSDIPDKGDWVRFSGQTKRTPVQCFYYRKTLRKRDGEKGDSTAPLFTELKVGNTVNNEKFARIQEINGFDIKITGHVIQQMTGEEEFQLDSADKAYQAGVFRFQ